MEVNGACMAKLKTNPVVESIRGKIGDLVFRRFGDEIIIGRTPNFAGQVPTAGQQVVRERFKLAAIYGKNALADPATKQSYRVKADDKGIPVFAATVADFFNEPVVDEVDLSGYTGATGGTIRIQAHDDFKVTGVAVRILNTDGSVVEEGPATQTTTGGSEWRYQTIATLASGQAVTIEVTALDRPGHKTVRTQAKT